MPSDNGGRPRQKGPYLSPIFERAARLLLMSDKAGGQSFLPRMGITVIEPPTAALVICLLESMTVRGQMKTLVWRPKFQSILKGINDSLKANTNLRVVSEKLFSELDIHLDLEPSDVEDYEEYSGDEATCQ